MIMECLTAIAAAAEGTSGVVGRVAEQRVHGGPGTGSENDPDADHGADHGVVVADAPSLEVLLVLRLDWLFAGPPRQQSHP